MFFGHRIIAAAALALLAGCSGSGVPVTWNEQIKQNYDPNSLGGATTSPGIRVSVVGDTFGEDRKTQSDKLAEILRESNFGPKVTFASRINDDDSYRAFEVRFLFSPQPGAAPETLCTDESFKQQPPQAGVVEFIAAYCRKGRRLNSIRGRVAGEFDSPAFKRLVAQAKYSLFPPPGYPFDGRVGTEFR